jgi:hypothetical protein
VGIRVTKVLGYGLTDIVKNDNKWTDPRFNSAFWKKLGEEDLDAKGLYAYVRSVLNTLSDNDKSRARMLLDSLKNESKDVYIDNCFAADLESEDSTNFVVIAPECQRQWYRHDDMIDYLECPYGEKVTPIDRPLYPYDSWMHAGTGEGLREIHNVVQVIRHFVKYPEAGQPEDYLKVHGYASLDEFRAIVVPYVPLSVRLLCEYVGVFKDPKTVLSLRPMIYSYWS